MRRGIWQDADMPQVSGIAVFSLPLMRKHSGLQRIIL